MTAVASNVRLEFVRSGVAKIVSIAKESHSQTIVTKGVRESHSIVIEGFNPKTTRNQKFNPLIVRVVDLLKSKPNEVILNLENIPKGTQVYSLESYRLNEIDNSEPLTLVENPVTLNSTTDQGIVLVSDGKTTIIEVKNAHYTNCQKPVGVCDLEITGSVEHVQNNGIPNATHLQMV